MIPIVLPMLFATRCCANLSTEAINQALGLALALIILFFQKLKGG